MDTSAGGMDVVDVNKCEIVVGLRPRRIHSIDIIDDIYFFAGFELHRYTVLIFGARMPAIGCDHQRRRILFAEFVAHMEDNRRLPKCVMFVELVGGAGCVGGQGKEWMGCFPDDLRASGINTD